MSLIVALIGIAHCRVLFCCCLAGLLLSVGFAFIFFLTRILDGGVEVPGQDLGVAVRRVADVNAQAGSAWLLIWFFGVGGVIGRRIQLRQCEVFTSLPGDPNGSDGTQHARAGQSRHHLAERDKYSASFRTIVRALRL